MTDARGVLVSVALAACLVAPAVARADASQLVFVGLQPLKQENGAGNLLRLSEAQAVRSVAQRVLQEASGQTVLGHDELTKLLGKKYLVDWFDCAGQLGCIVRILAPLRKAGYKTALTGDYYIDATGYRFRLVSFTVADGKVVKESTFEIAAADVKDPVRWRESLTPLLPSGRLRVINNIGDTTCKIDGADCKFESDGQTLTVAPGEHTIELTKDKYQPEKVVISVEAGTEKEVAIALKPLDKPAAVEGPKVGQIEGPRRAPALTAVRTEQPPEIDGKIDDASWQKAWLETNFTQNFPDEGKAPSQRTEVRVLYDDGAIYVAVRCFDTTPQAIVARLTRRDRDIDADKVTVDISSKNDRASAYHFQVNAAGVQVDGVRYNDTQYNNDWDGRWYSATSRDDQGWTAEMKIPLVTLRYSGDVSSFGFQVRRYLGRRGEIAEWAQVPRTAKGEVSYYGTIDNITGLNAKRLRQILVYDAHKVTFRNQQGTFDGRDTGGSVGADLKLGITPGLTLDGTINPDFGTVEVDQVVLNLSTVETYFPEKRPFFVEGADLFATPFNLFYSRRVGATPPSPTGPALVEPLPDGRILSALKVTGVLANRLSIGVLDALTARQDAEVQRTGGPRESLLVEPYTNFAVLRLRQEFATNSSIGVLATALNRFEPADEAAPRPTDLCPVPYSTTFTSLVAPPPLDGRCTNDAYTAGIDTTLRSASGEWAASAQVVGSLIQNGPTRLIPDGTEIGSGSTGWGLKSEAGRYGGDTHWLYRIGYSNASPRLQINDVGYQDVAGYHDGLASLVWRTTEASNNLQSASLELFAQHRRTANHFDNINTDVHLTLQLQPKNLWTILAMISPYFPKYVEHRETQDGARTQRNAGIYAFYELKTDPAKALVVGTTGSFLQVFDGITGFTASLSLSLRPVPSLELDLISNYSRQYGNSRWIETVTNMSGSRTYFFSELDATSFDVTLRGTYTLTRKLSLQAYLQPFVASGHFSTVTSSTALGEQPFLSLESFIPATAPSPLPDFSVGAINLNLFVRYEYLPLSALWLVYTRNQQQTGFDPAMDGSGRLRFDAFRGGPSTDVLLLKLSYLWY